MLRPNFFEAETVVLHQRYVEGYQSPRLSLLSVQVNSLVQYHLLNMPDSILATYGVQLSSIHYSVLSKCLSFEMFEVHTKITEKGRTE
jgi:hypothetical protein